MVNATSPIPNAPEIRCNPTFDSLSLIQIWLVDTLSEFDLKKQYLAYDAP